MPSKYKCPSCGSDLVCRTSCARTKRQFRDCPDCGKHWRNEMGKPETLQPHTLRADRPAKYATEAERIKARNERYRTKLKERIASGEQITVNNARDTKRAAERKQKQAAGKKQPPPPVQHVITSVKALFSERKTKHKTADTLTKTTRMRLEDMREERSTRVKEFWEV